MNKFKVVVGVQMIKLLYDNIARNSIMPCAYDKYVYV